MPGFGKVYTRPTTPIPIFFPNLIPLSLPLKDNNVVLMPLPSFGSSSHFSLTSHRFYPLVLSPDHLWGQDNQAQCLSLGRTKSHILCLLTVFTVSSQFVDTWSSSLALHLSLLTPLVLFLSPSFSSHLSFTLHTEPIPI